MIECIQSSYKVLTVCHCDNVNHDHIEH